MRDQESADALIRVGCWFWCQPQTLAGWILTMLFGWNRVRDGWTTNSKWRFKTGVSLGPFILLHKSYDLRTVQHEYGHSIQSWILGPLYLIVIGIPSVCWNLFYRRYRVRTLTTYYGFWCERWADKLAGIKR